MDNQDWETTYLAKKKGGTSSHKKGPHQQTCINSTMDDPEFSGMKKLSNETRTKFIQARIAKKLSQDQLAKQANVLVVSIKELESGKVSAHDAQKTINKCQRILKFR